MVSMFEYAVNLLGIAFELYIANLFFSKISKRKVSKRFFFIANIGLVIFQFLNNNLFLTNSSIVMLGTIIFLFLISLLYTNKILSKIYSSIFLLVILALSELAVALACTSLLNIDVQGIQLNIMLFAICTISSKFLAYTLVLSLRFNKKDNKNWLPVSLAFKTIPLPLASFFVLLLLLECSYRVDIFRVQVLTLVAAISLLVANIFIFYLIDKQNDYIETKESLKFAQAHIQTQISHYEELYKYQYELKAFRHDIQNKLLALYGLIKSQETKKALETIDRDLDFINKRKQSIVNSGNPVVDAIIQSKINMAFEKKIPMEFSIKLNEKIRIDELEFGVLIGNALDNAIEATEKIEAPIPNPIELRIISTNDRISLSIKNPVAANIDTNDLITTKESKEYHGYGIGSIKAISQKYDGEVFFDCKDNIFVLNANLKNAI